MPNALSAWIHAGASEFRAALDLGAVRQTIRDTSAVQLFVLLTAALGLVCSGVGQIISLNKLLTSFPTHGPEPVGGPFTAIVAGFFAAAMVFAAFTLLILPFRAATRRYLCDAAFPCIFSSTKKGDQPRSFLPQRGTLKAWGLLLAYGLCSSANGIFLSYGTRNTPELIQSMALSTQLIFFVGLSAAFKLGGTRSYCNVMVLTSVALSIAGVAVGTAGATSGLQISGGTIAWIFILLLGVVAFAGCSVIIALFFHQALPAGGPAAAASSAALPYGYVAIEDGACDAAFPTVAAYDELGANLWMLVFGNGIMSLMCFLFFPLDWAPFFGTAADAATSMRVLANGVRCVLGARADCHATASAFGVLVACIVGVTVSMTILSRVSPPLAGLLYQISSPLCALVLVIAPSLNANPSPTNVGSSVGALLLIAVGAVVFALWERLGDAGAVVESVSSMHAHEINV